MALDEIAKANILNTINPLFTAMKRKAADQPDTYKTWLTDLIENAVAQYYMFTSNPDLPNEAPIQNLKMTIDEELETLLYSFFDIYKTGHSSTDATAGEVQTFIRLQFFNELNLFPEFQATQPDAEQPPIGYVHGKALTYQKEQMTSKSNAAQLHPITEFHPQTLIDAFQFQTCNEATHTAIAEDCITREAVYSTLYEALEAASKTHQPDQGSYPVILKVSINSEVPETKSTVIDHNIQCGRSTINRKFKPIWTIIPTADLTIIDGIAAVPPTLQPANYSTLNIFKYRKISTLQQAKDNLFNSNRTWVLLGVTSGLLTGVCAFSLWALLSKSALAISVGAAIGANTLPILWPVSLACLGIFLTTGLFFHNTTAYTLFPQRQVNTPGSNVEGPANTEPKF